MRPSLAALAVLTVLTACADERPQSVQTRGLDTGIRGNGGGGLGSESVVGKPTGAGVINRVTVP